LAAVHQGLILKKAAQTFRAFSSRTRTTHLSDSGKKNCSDNYGLVIEKDRDGLYSVSFCGPGGCMKPETITYLANDSAYRVIDENTIEVKGKKGISSYRRCP